MTACTRGPLPSAMLALLILASGIPLLLPGSASAARTMWTFECPGELNSGPSVGDLDGDGNLSVVLAASNMGVTVLDSNGTLRWAFSFPSNVTTTPLLADINADGKLEIVAGTDDGTLVAISADRSLLWSYSAGGAIRGAPSAADLNGDGRLEIISGSEAKEVFAVGPGGQKVWSYATKGEVLASPAVGDFFGDGGLEVAVADTDGELYLLGSSGAPVWTRGPGGGAAPFVSDLALGDIDLDGQLEMLVAARDGNVSAVGPGGDLEWSFRAGGEVDSSLAVSDIDSDGKGETLFGCADGRLYCVGPAGSLEWSYLAAGPAAGPALFSVGAERRIAFLSQEGGLCILNGRGYLLWQCPVAALPRSSCAVADLRGFGESQLLVSGAGRTLQCIRAGELATLDWPTSQHDARRTGNLLSTRQGALPGSVKWSVPLADRVDSSPAVADVDGDGTREVAVGAGDGALYLLEGSDGGVRWSFPTAGGSARFPSPLISDLDGDLLPEVVGAGMDGKVYCIRSSNGSGLWESDIGIGGASPSAGDLDGDGMVEVGAGTDSAEFYSMDGRSGYWEWIYDLPGGVDAPAALADLDGDRRLEAVASAAGSGVVAISNGTVLWNSSATGFDGTAPALGDLDGDNIPDAVVGTGQGELKVFNGASGKQLWSRALASPAAEAPILADLLPGQGQDIVVPVSDGSLRAFSGRLGEQLWSVPAGAWSSPSAADIDRDGAQEILVGTNAGLRAYGPSGKPLWFFPVSGGVASSPAASDIEGDGSLEILFGGQDGAFYCLAAGGACQPRQDPWPCYRHDLRRTGNSYCYGGGFLPDLEIDSASIRLSEPFPDEGGQVLVNVTVRNLGASAAAGFAVTLSDNGNPVGDPLPVPKLAPASGSVVSFPWTPGGGGHSLRAEADPESKVGESRRDNNAAGRDVRVNFRPVASAGPDRNVDLGAVVIFDGSASRDPDGLVSDYNWSFGDGGSARGPQPTHRYQGPGRFTVILNVTDDDGASGTDALTVAVNSPPRILGRYPPSDVTLAENETAAFSVDAADPEGEPVTFLWLLDGAPAGHGPEFLLVPNYSSAGRHLLRVELSDGDRTSSTSWNVTVLEAESPLLEWNPVEGELSARSGEALDFRAVPRDDRQGIQWLLDGVPVHGATGKYFRLVTDLRSVGRHVVTALVNVSGHEARQEWRVNVLRYNAQPGIVHLEPQGDSVLLLSGSRQLFFIKVSDPDSAAISMQWFLDGAAILNETGNQYYYVNRGGAGRRNLTVTVTDGESTVSHSWAVTVNSPPTVVFLADRMNAVAGDEVGFDASRSFDPDGRVAEYRWQFGDGKTLVTNSSSVRHSYEKPGVYTVVLLVTDELGASSTSRLSIVVTRQPEKVGIPGFGAALVLTALGLSAALLGSPLYRREHHR